jgi:hypothetical protein
MVVFAVQAKTTIQSKGGSQRYSSRDQRIANGLSCSYVHSYEIISYESGAEMSQSDGAIIPERRRDQILAN